MIDGSEPSRDHDADIAIISSLEAVPTILEVVCRTTGMGFAAIARVTEERWIACGVRDDIQFGLRTGGELKVETTICHEVRQAGSVTVINNVAEDPVFCLHPTPAMYGFQSYISMPIILPDGTFFGTLCAIDPRPNRLDTPEVLGMFKMFAQLIGFQIDASNRLADSQNVRTLNDELERRVAERTAERDVLTKIVESTDIMIMGCDLDFNIIAINAANADEFERIYGVRPKVGDNLLELLTDQPEHQAEVKAGWGLGISGEEVTIVEDFGDSNRIRPYYEFKFRNLRDEHGKRIGCYQFATDVTQRLREQAKLAEAQAALRQSQKMEAVGQLTGGIAHDFNNLLTGISGSLEILETRLAQGRVRDLNRYIMAAQGAAKRAASLTHRLLAFSRQQTLEPKFTYLDRLIAEMEELIRRTMGPAIAVEVIGTSRPWNILVDQNQLENALLNLCINARDAMPDGGRLTVETSNELLDERGARERNLTPGQYVALCVSDTGIGMDANVVERAFDPFFTTKPIGAGTGLGLSMVYGFVQQSGGQARICSELGHGAMICLYLPRHFGAEEQGSDPPRAATAQPRAREGETVLVVDDEPTVRMLVVEALEELGYATIEAADGASGLQLLQADIRIDLLITDVGLPGGMTGRQMADAARATRPELNVLFITGYPENVVAGDDRLGLNMHILTKPFSMGSLASKVQLLMDRHYDEPYR